MLKKLKSHGINQYYNNITNDNIITTERYDE